MLSTCTVQLRVLDFPFSFFLVFCCAEGYVSWPIRDRSVLLSVHWILNKWMWSNGEMMIKSGKLERLKIK